MPPFPYSTVINLQRIADAICGTRTSQFSTSASRTTVGTTNMYSPTSERPPFLSAAHLFFSPTKNSVVAKLQVDIPEGNTIDIFNFQSQSANVMHSASICFPVPMRLANDQTVKLIVSGADGLANASIHGWEEFLGDE